MDLSEFLRRENVTLDELAARMRESLGLIDGDLAYVCGSLVEGIGNEKSDLDLYLITSRRDVAFSSLSSVFVALGRTVCDVCVVDRAVFEQTIDALHRWAALEPRQVRASMAIRENERRLLHRARIGIALHGGEEFERVRARISPQLLARHKLDWARYHADLAQVDLAGMREAGDWRSMILMAQELLGHTADALLAAHGELNPSPKWRAKLLERLPADWERTLPGIAGGRSPVDRYFDLHCFKGDLIASDIFAFTSRISSFSRRVLAWAELRTLSPDLTATPSFGLARGTASGATLPALDLEVVIRFREGELELLRLTAPEKCYRLTPDSCALLALFDGETSREEGLSAAAELWGEEAASDRLDELVALIRHAGLEAQPPVDEPALEALFGGR